MIPPDIWDRLRAEADTRARNVPELAYALRETACAHDRATGLACLLARLVNPIWMTRDAATALAHAAFIEAPDAVAAALADLDAITTRNFEPGGLVGTWIGGRGFHMLAAHRVGHVLWNAGSHDLAMAWKTAAAALGSDIHPAARIGRRIFLDHGIGVVIGETADIEDDVSIWHGVTLGSTLMQSGDRHPKIRRGAVIGAGATILGNIEIGEGAVVAAGSMVLAPVPPFTTVAGNPARAKPTHRHPYGYAAQEAAT